MRGAWWIPAPDRAEGRLCAGRTDGGRQRRGEERPDVMPDLTGHPGVEGTRRWTAQVVDLRCCGDHNRWADTASANAVPFAPGTCRGGSRTASTHARMMGSGFPQAGWRPGFTSRCRGLRESIQAPDRSPIASAGRRAAGPPAIPRRSPASCGPKRFDRSPRSSP